ncbi:MAG: succinate dehydrogenase/fumarate reductase iron-sulfur subunit [Chromatocurvus sp.]
MSENMSGSIGIRVQRYRPEIDDAPWWQSFEVPWSEDTSVLDALNHIKDHLDASLSYRWSCRMAICGSCGVMVNDEPRLGCKTFLRNYADAGEISVRALENLAVERDLVGDIEPMLTHIETVQPWLQRQQPAAPEEGEYRQTPAQMARYESFSHCINCGLCYAACPQFGANPDFLGPAALTLAQRYNLDSRDEGREQRMPFLNGADGVWACTFVGYCSDVCPKDVDPAAAINQGKVASNVNYAVNLFRLLRERDDA